MGKVKKYIQAICEILEMLAAGLVLLGIVLSMIGISSAVDGCDGLSPLSGGHLFDRHRDRVPGDALPPEFG